MATSPFRPAAPTARKPISAPRCWGCPRTYQEGLGGCAKEDDAVDLSGILHGQLGDLLRQSKHHCGSMCLQATIPPPFCEPFGTSAHFRHARKPQDQSRTPAAAHPNRL
jgi:hypothetical protein